MIFTANYRRAGRLGDDVLRRIRRDVGPSLGRRFFRAGPRAVVVERHDPDGIFRVRFQSVDQVARVTRDDFVLFGRADFHVEKFVILDGQVAVRS